MFIWQQWYHGKYVPLAVVMMEDTAPLVLADVDITATTANETCAAASAQLAVTFTVGQTTYTAPLSGAAFLTTQRGTLTITPTGTWPTGWSSVALITQRSCPTVTSWGVMGGSGRPGDLNATRGQTGVEIQVCALNRATASLPSSDYQVDVAITSRY